MCYSFLLAHPFAKNCKHQIMMHIYTTAMLRREFNDENTELHLINYRTSRSRLSTIRLIQS
jgi:hypothetical protein